MGFLRRGASAPKGEMERLRLYNVFCLIAGLAVVVMQTGFRGWVGEYGEVRPPAALTYEPQR
jgi:hypothetical protein